MKKWLLCCCMLLPLLPAAQLIDSLPLVVRQKHSIDARLESRYGFIRDNLTTVNGFRLGIAFRRKLRIGGGVSWLNTPVAVPFTPYATETGLRRQKFLKFGYLCYYLDFVFYRNKRWQLSVPLQLGAGLAWYQQKQLYKLFSNEPKHFVLLYEPGITVQFKIFRWLGLGNDVAYRFILKDNKTMAERLSSPTYSFKLLFWFDQLFFEVFPDAKLSRKYGPAYW